MDLILAVFFLLAVIRGWYIGLAMRVAHLAVVVVSAVVAYGLAHMLGVMPLFGIFFIAAVVLLNQAAKVVRIVEWIPVVGTLNKAGGALIGFVLAFLVCYVLLHFLFETIPQQVWNQWGLTEEVIAKTYLLQAFY